MEHAVFDLMKFLVDISVPVSDGIWDFFQLFTSSSSSCFWTINAEQNHRISLSNNNTCTEKIQSKILSIKHFSFIRTRKSACSPEIVNDIKSHLKRYRLLVFCGLWAEEVLTLQSRLWIRIDFFTGIRTPVVWLIRLLLVEEVTLKESQTHSIESERNWPSTICSLFVVFILFISLYCLYFRREQWWHCFRCCCCNCARVFVYRPHAFKYKQMPLFGFIKLFLSHARTWMNWKFVSYFS